ncbi:MAG: aquaporin [Micrococcales bacterium]
MSALARKLFAEFLGVAVFVTAIVGVNTPMMGSALAGLAAATTLGLMILATASFSGGHLNPAVSLYFFARKQLSVTDFVAYVAAQLLGGLTGAYLGGAIWGFPGGPNISQATPAGSFASEILATAILVTLVGHLAQSKQGQLIPVAVTAWVFAAGTFTSSGAFANPAVTLGRVFASHAGISPSGAGSYVLAQVIGCLVAVILVGYVFNPAVGGKKGKGAKKAKKK